MAKGYLPLPDGSYVTVRDDETPEQAFARARKEYPEAFEVKRVSAEPEEGVMARLLLAVQNEQYLQLVPALNHCFLQKKLLVRVLSGQKN
jgi:hypothetical protein